MNDADFRQKLTPEQYKVLREKGTEPPFSGKLLHISDDGTYSCAACGNELFKSDTKFESTMPGLVGWPAFSDIASNVAVKLERDTSMGMERTEVVCSNCGSHLGHYFDDPTSPNSKHYCVNSLALSFEKH
jgi:peptide-methionine (R)-S-oxide reductase